MKLFLNKVDIRLDHKNLRQLSLSLNMSISCFVFFWCYFMYNNVFFLFLFSVVFVLLLCRFFCFGGQL